MNDPEPSKTIQPIAEAIRRSVGADFVVVANKDGILGHQLLNRIEYAFPRTHRVTNVFAKRPPQFR